MAEEGASNAFPSPMSPINCIPITEGLFDSPTSTPTLICSPESEPDVDVDARDKEKVPGSTAGKLYSKVHSHYDRMQIDGKWKAKCKYCSAMLLGDLRQGTSHLNNHQKRCPRKKTPDIRQQLLQANFNKDKFDVSAFNFDKDITRKKIARMIILHEYPMMMVEHEGFRDLCNTLNPLFQPVSRNTIKGDCIKLYESEKVAILQVLEKNDGRVALTTDMWTASHQKKGFMAVTAHFIDNNWKLQSQIIRFVYVPSPHTSDALCEALFECLFYWNIDRKISSITVDNCSTNDAMLSLLVDKLPSDALLLGGKLLHMRCCAHILNLIVKDGLDIIEGAVKNIRDSVAYWSGTPKRWEKFEETAHQNKVGITKKLALDCKTRWNSTFLMLQTALDYKDVFSRLKFRDAKYKCSPSEDEWRMTKVICGKLVLFYEATELFSGTKYPTSNLCFQNICEIKLALIDWSVCGVDIIEKMAQNMMEKFDKYWLHVHGIMGVATILDPRYKSDLLEYYFGKIYVNDVDFEVEKILVLCRELLEQYERDYEDGDCEKSDIEPTRTLGKNLSDFDLFTSRKKRKPTRSELDLYLEEGTVPREEDFDVLRWWWSNKGKYPILSRIAKDILAIPISTVASESAFSTSGRLISPERSRLHPTTVEAFMCAQSWLSLHIKDGNAKANVFYDEDDENKKIME